MRPLSPAVAQENNAWRVWWSWGFIFMWHSSFRTLQDRIWTAERLALLSRDHRLWGSLVSHTSMKRLANQLWDGNKHTAEVHMRFGWMAKRFRNNVSVFSESVEVLYQILVKEDGVSETVWLHFAGFKVSGRSCCKTTSWSKSSKPALRLMNLTVGRSYAGFC